MSSRYQSLSLLPLHLVPPSAQAALDISQLLAALDDVVAPHLVVAHAAILVTLDVNTHTCASAQVARIAPEGVALPCNSNQAGSSGRSV